MTIEIHPGTRLATKDGRQIGNAVVVRRAKASRVDSLLGNNHVWLIETDFGSFARLTEVEIRSQFYIEGLTDLVRWRNDRRANFEAQP